MMLTRSIIDKNATVSDIVNSDYRAADVFKKYNIGYCCGGKYPLQMACEINNLNTDQVVSELITATQPVNNSNTLPFNEWSVDFLANYIVNVHHQYLRKALPLADELVSGFAEGHRKKFDYLDEVQTTVKRMAKQMLPHMEHEEKVIFPYVHQIHHAYHHSEPYASLFVKTLRKPVAAIMEQEHETTGRDLLQLRQLTNNYTTPEKACLSHRVAFNKLKEVDTDIVRHIYLENEILFPRVIQMEKELSENKNSF